MAARRRPARGDGADIASLVPAARAVRDRLRLDGRPLTCDALAAGLRGSGHRVRHDRLTHIVAALRDNPAVTT